MSTFLYAALSNQRKEAPSGTSTSRNIAVPGDPRAGKPGVSTWTDALAALVPAEILAAQAFLIGLVTTRETEPSISAEPVTVITNAGQAKVLFFVLIAAAMAFYVFSALGRWEKLDWLRMLIPPIAFFLWSLLEPTSAFDAVADLDDFWRYLIGIVGALLLAPIAKWLAYKADQSEPAPVEEAVPAAPLVEQPVG